MSKKKSVIILGAGQHAKVIRNIFELNGKKTFFLDDYVAKPISIGHLKDLPKFSNDMYDFFIAFGDNNLRKKWFLELNKRGRSMTNAIHPSSYMESSVRLGKNVMIGANVYVNVNALIGDNVIINNGSIIEHDNIIEDNVQIAPGVITGGGAIIRKNSFLGLGCILIDHVSVEENNIVGAGSVIIDNTLPNGLYVGVPAVRKRDL